MYMVQTFMLHVSLHWFEYGVSGLALWPSAVKHAMWLYSWMPSKLTVLLLIEVINKTHSDH